ERLIRHGQQQPGSEQQGDHDNRALRWRTQQERDRRGGQHTDEGGPRLHENDRIENERNRDERDPALPASETEKHESRECECSRYMHGCERRPRDITGADAFQAAARVDLPGLDTPPEATYDVRDDELVNALLAVQARIDQREHQNVLGKESRQKDMIAGAQRPGRLDPEPDREDDQRGYGTELVPGRPLDRRLVDEYCN